MKRNSVKAVVRRLQPPHRNDTLAVTFRFDPSQEVRQRLDRNQHGVRVAGLNYKDKPENARRFLGSLGNPYKMVGVDDKGSAAVNWGVYGVPETFLVDGAGVIRYKWIGPITQQALTEELLPRIRSTEAKASP